MRCKAYAKINLCLEVLGKRDDGFHEIKTIVQTIDMADDIDITESDTLTIDCDDVGIPSDSNIVNTAAKVLLEYCCVTRGAHISLAKNIPVGFGFGGGSADAAATLYGLNLIWKLGLSTVELIDVAAKIGSDVPALLTGGTILAEGAGEIICELPSISGPDILLICPSLTIPEKTRHMYSHITQMHYSDGGATDRMINNINQQKLIDTDIFNIFETIAMTNFKGLSELYTMVQCIGGVTPHLCGAGPAMYCLLEDQGKCKQLADICYKYGADTYVVHAIMPTRPNI
jgi:4-diphosphocytidyl-2-C-methyl-D-erythritol kinase